jgi:hypothetical protein
VKGVAEFMQRNPNVVFGSDHVLQNKRHPAFRKRGAVSVRHFIWPRAKIHKAVPKLAEFVP